MKILYCSSLEIGSTARHRFLAMGRLGHEVIPFDFDPYYRSGNRWQRWIRFRTLRGEAVRGLNRDMMDRVGKGRFDMVWVDKGLWITPENVQAISRTVRIIHFMDDIPVPRRKDPGWQGLLAAIPHYHRLIQPSPDQIPPLLAMGAKAVEIMPFTYEPTIHYPPPAGWSDADRDLDVTFVGTPYDQRPRFLPALARALGRPVTIHGNRWQRALPPWRRGGLVLLPEAIEGAYREVLWRSKIVLGLVSHPMGHQSARRWPEITACGAFMLAEGTRLGAEHFQPDQEAVFFTNVEDCAAAIRCYMDDAPARQAIAQKGHERAWGHLDNDGQLKRIIDRL